MTNSHKNLILCFDGTWNNPYQKSEREDGSNVLKPTNPLKLARAVLPWDEDQKRQQVTYYDTGVGSLGKYPGISNWLRGTIDNALGGGWGAGFEANIEQAVTFLAHNYQQGDSVYLFGFSRGAAQARALTRFIDWMGGLPTKSDAYFIPMFFNTYIGTQGTGSPGEVKTASGNGPSNPLQALEVNFLGVWDTVMALGSRFRSKSRTTVDDRSFHVGITPANCVTHARQALAIDEQRYDFRPEIWRICADHQSLQQRWFVGVHSNIGGGYVKDGLANIAFQWLLGEAKKRGLAVDKKFTKHYPPFPQAKLYRSRSLGYKVLEAIRFKRGKGVRPLTSYPETANLMLDKSVIHRVRSDPASFDQLELYRPGNVLSLLNEHKSDLAAYLASLGVEPEEPILPEDVLSTL